MADLTDLEPATFPILLQDGYRASATNRIHLVIDHSKASVDTLTVAWGTVLATYTNSNDVLFGLVQPSCSDVHPCLLRLQPEQPITAALKQATSITSALNGALESAKEFHNILVIQTGGEAFREKDSTYPLEVLCQIQQDAIQVQAIFDSGLLAPETAQMMLFQLRHAHNSITHNPHDLLAVAQDCSPEGIEKLIRWNSETAPGHSQTLGHHLIEQRCREQPSAQAVCAWDGTLTFRELEVEASKLASRLIAAGVGPDRFVGLLMEKSMWTTVAIFAVMKAGGCFFLMDASQPLKRLALMCSKAQPRLLLASAKHEAIAQGLDILTLVVPRDISQSTSTELQPETVQPHHTLYAGFTSGSTGEPKGFVMDHTAFSSGLTTYCEQGCLSAESRVLQYASYAFIVSVTDQIAPLTQGACICVPSEEQLQNDLSGAIRSFAANWAKLTPSVLRLLDPVDVAGLRSLIMVGEPMTAAELAKWQGHNITLFSLYGLSENAKGGMFGSRNESGCDIRKFSRPFCATPWIVSPHDPNILMPIGAEGEMLFEGPCVSKGYMDNEAQNRLTFLEDPAWLRRIRPDGHARFLRTGDLVRYNPDGTLHLLGRKGTRVKIRGQRIELAEIEHHLRSQFDTKEPSVVEVVTPSDDTSKTPTLVMFVPVGEQEPTSQRQSLTDELFVSPTQNFRQKAQRALRNLQQVLPSFMVPQFVVALVALPQTPTGKLHRRLLREKASKLTRNQLSAYTSEEAPHKDPSTPKETILRDVCAQVLNLPPGIPGMQSNFFNLGGNSITARELVTKCRQFGLHLTVADVFQQPSLSALAECHQELDTSSLGDAAYDPFKSIRDDFLANTPAPLAADQIEDVFPALEEQSILASTNMLDYHLFELTGPVDVSKLHHAVQALVNKHNILRSIFVPFSGQIMQVVLRHVDVPVTLHSPPADQSAKDWARSFCNVDLEVPYRTDEPHLEVQLVQDAPEHFVLVMRVMHAQYDAISFLKLIPDLWAAYEGQDIHIESDFSAYARECLRQRTPEAYRFWQDMLLDSQVTPGPFRQLSVPTERNTGFERKVVLPIPPVGITMATVVKAAWAITLQERTGFSDVVFGQLITSRNLLLPGVDEIVGPCLNTVPVRVQQTLQSGNTYDLLRAVQSQYAESIGFETIGWDDMAKRCTKWPAGTKPGSVVMFQNFERDPGTQFGQLKCQKLGQVFKLPPEQTVYLLVFPAGGGAVISLEASNSILRKDEAEQLLDRFYEVMKKICTT